MSISDADAIVVAEQVDRLVTTEIGGKMRTIARTPVIRDMYDTARKAAGGAPISYAVAKTLARVCAPGRHVLFTTGFTIDLWMHGETDGPPGVATLARALERAFGVKPLVLTESAHREFVTATVRAAGLRDFGAREAAEIPRRFSVIELPIDLAAARSGAKDLFDSFQIAALIAIEKPGANRFGVYHNSGGRDVSHLCGKIEPYLEEAARRDIPTISMFDLGNEVGAGGMTAVLRDLPNAVKCACPCGGGNVAASKVTHAFPAFTSNWGAYAVEAMLAFMLDWPALLHDADLERDVLRECGRAGGVSSPEGYSGSMVDRVPLLIHVKIIELLHYMIGSARDELNAPLRHNDERKKR